MNLLLEAIFLNFEYTTGIERHFLLQLEIIEKSCLFDKVYIVVKHQIPQYILNTTLNIETVIIMNNSVEEWENIYQNYRFDLVYSSFVPPCILPPERIPVLYVLHDPGRYIYPDMMAKDVLERHMDLFEEHVEKKQFYVITVSKSSKKDILKYFPQLQDRIFVIYNFINNKFSQLKQKKIQYNLPYSPNRYFLTVGRFLPTKNTLSIVKAFEGRKSKFKDFKLIIVGRKGWYSDLDDYLEDYNRNRDDIVSLGYVTDQDLFLLYKNAYGFISASIYEGFGLPLIEAQFCGCPRIFCSDIPVYHEINLENITYFDPFNYLDLRDKTFTQFKRIPGKMVGRDDNRISLNAATIRFLNIVKSIC